MFFWEILFISLAFSATSVCVYALNIYIDETLHQNRLFSTSVGGVAFATLIAGAVLHFLSSMFSTHAGLTTWLCSNTRV